MAQAERDARQAKRKARRQQLLTAVRTAVRTLDEDDREALKDLARGAVARLSDGDISAEDIAILAGLVADLAAARRNTP